MFKLQTIQIARNLASGRKIRIALDRRSRFRTNYRSHKNLGESGIYGLRKQIELDDISHLDQRFKET